MILFCLEPVSKSFVNLNIIFYSHDEKNLFRQRSHHLSR